MIDHTRGAGDASLIDKIYGQILVPICSPMGHSSARSPQIRTLSAESLLVTYSIKEKCNQNDI